MINPNPGCKGECRFVTSGGETTLVGWTPEYDKHGNLVSKNPNRVREYVNCRTCGKSWTIESQGLTGKTLITEG